MITEKQLKGIHKLRAKGNSWRDIESIYMQYNHNWYMTSYKRWCKKNNIQEAGITNKQSVTVTEHIDEFGYFDAMADKKKSWWRKLLGL